MIQQTLNTFPIVGDLRNKPNGGSEVFNGYEWVHYSDDTWENANTRIFNQMNPAPHARALEAALVAYCKATGLNPMPAQ
jgi:hypothetical protein